MLLKGTLLNTLLFLRALGSLIALLLLMVLLCALLFLLGIRRSGDSEKQRQNGCAGDSNYFHRCYLQNCWLRNACPSASFLLSRFVALPIASPGHEKNNSLIFLPAGGVAVSPPTSMGSPLFISVPRVS